MTIVTTIKSGTEKEFTAVYHQYHIKLYNYFFKKTRSGELAMELVQIVFIKLWSFRHTLTEDYSFDTQFFNIARTCLVDHLRQQSAQRARSASLPVLTDVQSTAQPDNSFEAADYFYNATQSLPPVRKKIFILHRLQGFTYKEIAHQLSISVNTVEDHMVKAIRQIKTITSLFL